MPESFRQIDLHAEKQGIDTTDAFSDHFPSNRYDLDCIKWEPPNRVV